MDDELRCRAWAFSHGHACARRVDSRIYRIVF
jgi:hypothetical protein